MIAPRVILLIVCFHSCIHVLVSDHAQLLKKEMILYRVSRAPSICMVLYESYLYHVIMFLFSISSQHATVTSILGHVSSTWSYSSCQGGSVEECAWTAGTIPLDVTVITVRKASSRTQINQSPIGKCAKVSNIDLIVCGYRVDMTFSPSGHPPIGMKKN